MIETIANPAVYAASEADRCLLCNDSPCSKACGKIDAGRVIRAYYFKNRQGAALRVAGAPDCAACETRNCQKVCIRKRVDRPVDIPFLMKHIRGEAMGAPDPKTEVDPTLAIDFCGFRCENPFVLGSSVITSSYGMCAAALRMGWAGVVIKTLTRVLCREASPRFDVSDKCGSHFSGFKNLEQLSEHRVEEDLKWIKQLKADFPSKLIVVSIMGRDETEWEELSRLVTENGADIIECNFSCPQMTYKNMGSDTGQNSKLVETYTRACRKGTKLPILAKLTPNLSAPDGFVQAALRGGATGIAGINTVKSLTTVDFRTTGNSGNSGKTAVSGYSGRAVKPIALRFMRDTAAILPPERHTLSGIGGVESWRDAMDFIMIGCANIQVCTAVMEYGQRIIEDLTEGLQLFLKKNNVPSLDSFVGTALGSVVAAADLDRESILYPAFDKTTCIRCGRCYISCRDGGHQAIELICGRMPQLIREKCVGCHLCRLVCPVGSIREGDRISKTEVVAAKQAASGVCAVKEL